MIPFCLKLACRFKAQVRVVYRGRRAAIAPSAARRLFRAQGPEELGTLVQLNFSPARLLPVNTTAGSTAQRGASPQTKRLKGVLRNLQLLRADLGERCANATPHRRKLGRPC